MFWSRKLRRLSGPSAIHGSSSTMGSIKKWMKWKWISTLFFHPYSKRLKRQLTALWRKWQMSSIKVRYKACKQLTWNQSSHTKTDRGRMDIINYRRKKVIILATEGDFHSVKCFLYIFRKYYSFRVCSIISLLKSWSVVLFVHSCPWFHLKL